MTTTTPPTTTNAARAVAASKIYGKGDTEVRALDSIDVEFGRAQYTAIMGPSGSGKSTLLHCIAGLDRLTSGHAFLGDLDISALSEKQLTEVRRDRIGFVFQAYNLIPTLNALENITLPAALAGRPEVIFADEPTGNLDSRSSAEILTFMRDVVDNFGQTIVMVTHDPTAAAYADRVVFLTDGRIVDELHDPTADSILDKMRTLDY